MGLEGDAFFFDLPELRQRKDLEAAGIGQDRSLPVHELPDPAHLLYDRIAGAHVQMIGVAELDLGPDARQVDGGDGALDRARRTDVHEYRRLHRAVHGLHVRAFRPSLGRQDLIFHITVLHIQNNILFETIICEPLLPDHLPLTASAPGVT